MTRNQPSYLSEALEIISAAVETYPDSRHLAQSHAFLLAECGRDESALEACEAFLSRFGIDDRILEWALPLRRRIGFHDTVRTSGAASLSLCMIVKNEEKNLPKCLASLKPVVNEVIIVDTGSTDRTADIALLFGARVFSYPWNNNFSDARNYAIEQASGAWILVMDADEVLARRDYESVRKVLGGDRHNVWSVVTRNYTDLHAHGWQANDGAYPVEESGCGWHPSSKVRLFPNVTEIRFRGEVHEMVEDSAELAGFSVCEAPFVVHHYGGLAPREDGPTPKQMAYFQIGRNKLLENPDNLAAIGELAVQAAELKLYDEAIDLWDRFLALQPDASVALFNKGFALMGLERYKEALCVERKVLEMEPSHKEAAFNYGICALYTGDIGEAITRLTRTRREHPQHPPLLSILCVLLLATDLLEEAHEIIACLQRLNYAISGFVETRAAVIQKLGNPVLSTKILDGWKNLAG